MLSNDGGIPVIMIEGTEVPFPTLGYPLEGRMDFDTIQKRVSGSLMNHEKFSHVMSPVFLMSLNKDKFYLVHHLNEHGLQALQEIQEEFKNDKLEIEKNCNAIKLELAPYLVLASLKKKDSEA
jgi:hypothetical protein